MKKDTVIAIISGLIDFKPVVESICALHDNDELATVKLLLFNIAQDATDCVNYSVEEYMQDVDKTLVALETMRKYNGESHPILKYFVGQISSIVNDTIMAADFAEESMPPYVCSLCNTEYNDGHDCECGKCH